MRHVVISRTIFGRLAFAAVMLALIMRMIVPQGWMPSRTDGFVISICTGVDGMKQAVLGKDGKLREMPAQSKPEKSSETCAFAGMAAAGLPPYAAASGIEIFAKAQIIQPARYATEIGKGLAAPPPPATGPPFLI